MNETINETPDTAADGFIKGMSAAMSAIECSTSEREHPQPEITEPDPLKARIIAILTENTGCDILDSGGAYGRRWEKNRHVPVDEWDNAPACTIEVYGDDEIVPTYNIYHYLTNFLSISEESERLNAVMRDIIDKSEDTSYIDDMETFLEGEDIELEGYALHDITNTYNYDTLLSQILQYAVFEYEGDPYILLQVHGGCDARGGYTRPQVFELIEADYFILASVDVTARCECCDWCSDDAGQHYYKDGTCPSPDPDWNYDADKNTVTCKECGKPVEFYVTESV